MVDFEAWNQYCIQSFDGNEFASQFVFYLESNAKTTPLNSTQFHTTWTLTGKDKQKYKQPLTDIHLYRKKKFDITISLQDWNKMQEIKRNRRRDWHECTQKKLQNHLFQQLQEEPTLRFDVSLSQRITMFESFYKEQDLGSVPFLNSLFGLFQFQLNHPFVAEWHMDQYKVTQAESTTKIDDYLRVLRSLLGLRYLYTEGDNIVWLINDHIMSDDFLKAVIKLQKPIVAAQDVYLTDIPKENESVIVKWSYHLLSLLHQHLK